MRKPFIQTLEKLMEKDKDVVLLYGDVGFSFMEPLMAKYPKQCINAGIAEQNMMGMAAGMARGGLKPYVYTMANFVLLRPHEQLRNDICFPNENVKLFAVHGGPSYAFLGMSHNLFEGEEQAILNTLPNISVHFPTEEDEVVEFMQNEYERKGCAYFSI